jgi:hypothetical protein
MANPELAYEWLNYRRPKGKRDIMRDEPADWPDTETRTMSGTATRSLPEKKRSETPTAKRFSRDALAITRGQDALLRSAACSSGALPCWAIRAHTLRSSPIFDHAIAGQNEQQEDRPEWVRNRDIPIFEGLLGLIYLGEHTLAGEALRRVVVGVMPGLLEIEERPRDAL